MSLSRKVSPSSRVEDDKNIRKKSVIKNFLGSNKGRLFGSNTCITDISCCVHLLDDTCMSVSLSNKAFGRCLLEVVCERLGVLSHISYFGLRYCDNNSINQWLNLNDKVYKQLKDVKNSTLCFRFIYYPNNPLKCFPNETIRHLIYLQLRRDFYAGRLRAQASKTYELAAYAIQAEHGLTEIPQGFNVDTIPGGMRVLPCLTTAIIRGIKAHLKTCICMSKTEALEKFIEEASKIETYGMEPFQVQDQRQNGLCIGFNYKGISIFKDGFSTNVFEWAFIKNIYPAKKNLVMIVSNGQSEEKDLVLGFKCKSCSEAKTLCMRALNCKTFKEMQIEEMSFIAQSFRTSSILNYRPSVLINQDSFSDSSDSLQSHSPKNKIDSNTDIQLEITSPPPTTTTSDCPETSTGSETSESTAWPVSYEAFNENRRVSDGLDNPPKTPNLDEPRHSLTMSYLNPPAKPTQRVSPRGSFGGSMELPTPSESKPQVADLFWNPKSAHHLVNGSSINVNKENSK
uniref:FERM domain-containing protein n=1 Tax=Trichobilharzia regenti TaxID=157069 RepID=A0AA85JTB7_TRIRE|nr:unnamed protein product [Trichobilharzia regenti]